MPEAPLGEPRDDEPRLVAARDIQRDARRRRRDPRLRDQGLARRHRRARPRVRHRRAPRARGDRAAPARSAAARARPPAGRARGPPAPRAERAPRPRPRARPPKTPKGPRPGGGAHWGRRIFALIALVVIVGVLYVVNATFQPFHGDGEGTVAVDDPGEQRRGGGRQAARRQGRDRLGALLRAQRDDQRRPRRPAPGQVHAQEGHDQRRGDRRADHGPGDAAGRRDGQRDARRGPVAQGERAGRRRLRQGRGQLRQGLLLEGDAQPHPRPRRAQGHQDRRGLPLPGDLRAQRRLPRERARQAAARRVRGQLQGGRHEVRQAQEPRRATTC